MLYDFRIKSKEYYEKYGEKNVILEMFSDIDYNVIIINYLAMHQNYLVKRIKFLVMPQKSNILMQV